MFRGFWGRFPYEKPPFRVNDHQPAGNVVIICPESMFSLEKNVVVFSPVTLVTPPSNIKARASLP